MFVKQDEDDSSAVFIYPDELERNSLSQLKDVEIGEYFYFRGKRYRKTSDQGWAFGICNIVDSDEKPSHLHPTANVSLEQ